jgi:hypothetical protein
MVITLATTMPVRFRQSPRRLYLSLDETRWESGKVRHDYVASLGAIATRPTIADRIYFRTSLHQRLGRLANRLDDAMRAKILGAAHARVPMPTQDEIHALQLEHARQHETAWRVRQIQTEGIVEAHKVLRDGASKLVSKGEPLLAVAAEELTAAKERRERIERGEIVPLPGKPPSLKELGMTPAHARHALTLAELTPEQFERFLEFGRRPADVRRRDYAQLRRFLRAEAKRQHPP